MHIDLATLEKMNRTSLLELWRKHLDGSPPKRLSSPFLRRILAFEAQTKAYAGLSKNFLKKLDRHVSRDGNNKSTKLKPGGRLLREWNGTTHVVDVVADGFLWQGERYRSLSAIARTITGAHWSGPRFFGLNGKQKQ